MAQRNTLCNHQMLDLQSEQGLRHFNPNHCIRSEKIADYANQSLHPGHSASRFYVNEYNSFQNLHAVPNHDPSCAASSVFYTPCMLPSSSSYSISAPLNLNEFIRDNQFIDSNRGFSKRKTAELPPVNQHNIDGSVISSVPSFSLPLNCGLSQWEELYEAGLTLTGCTNFEHPGYRERGNVHTAEGSYRSVRSSSNLVSLPPESAYFHHPHYLLQITHMGQQLHPAISKRMAQFGMENGISNGACPNWNYNHPITNMQGTIEMTNMGVPTFPDPLSGLNSAVLINVTPLPYFHQQLSSAHAMQLRSYGHQVQMQAISYPHPLNNLHPIGVNHFSDGLNSGPSFSNFHLNGGQASRPLWVHNTAPDFSHRSVRILSDEDAEVMDISRFHRVNNAIDQLQNMRLDIDEMSYEELLALEEQIGDAKTGLTAEYINTNLKTNLHNSQRSVPTKELERYLQENEACIICQDEYLEYEITGTLDCGHTYHGECIKQWLLVKNSCPICKKTALVKDDSEG